MCREFVVSCNNAQLKEQFSLPELPPIETSYSVRRGHDIATIHESRASTSRASTSRSSTSSTRSVQKLRWGLVPHWRHDDMRERRIFNARAETLHQKPAFRESLAERRCIVPASGFFEWTTQRGIAGERNSERESERNSERESERNSERVPFYVEAKSGAPLGFAALWDEWYSREGELVRSCAIITTESNRLLSPHHARMPAILHHDNYAQWLNPHHFDVRVLRSMLQPFEAKKLSLRFLPPHNMKYDNDNPLRVQGEEIEYSHGEKPRKRLVLRDWQSPDGQVFFETRSFTRDDYTWWHPVVDLESGSVWCDCPDFHFRHAPHEPSIQSPHHWCKHVARAVANCRRHGEVTL